MSQDRPRRRPPKSTGTGRRTGGRVKRGLSARRRFLRRRLTLLGSVVAVVAAVGIVLFTPVLGVRSVEVLGVEELSADDVRAAAGIESGTPLARLDTDEIVTRVAALPRVGAVQVRRSLPSTVEVVITERSPMAVVRADDGAHLIDRTGMDYGVVKVAPAGLPTLVAADQVCAAAAVVVLAAVPEPLRVQVVSLSARTQANVQLTLGDGRVVKWGGAEDSDRKAAVLGPLLTQKGKVYDVAAPDFPTIA